MKAGAKSKPLGCVSRKWMYTNVLTLLAVGTIIGHSVSAQNPQRLWAVSGFPNFCYFAQFTPIGDLITADIRNLKLWNTNGWTFKRDVCLNEYGFSAATISPDGNWVAFTGIVGSPVRWLNLKTFELRSTLSSNSVFGLDFSPDSSLLASAEGTNARLIRVSDGLVTREFSADGAEVYGVAFSPDGTRLATATKTGLRMWSVVTGALLFAPVTPATGYRVAFSPDGSRLAVSADATVQILNATNGSTEAAYLGHSDFVHSLAWAPNGSNVLSATYSTQEPSAHLWNAITGGFVRQFRAGTSSIYSICFSPDGKIVVTAASAVEAWDTVTGAALGEVGAFHGSLLDCAISPDGETLATATGGLDLRLRLWRASDGEPLQTWHGHTSHVYAVAFAPDGTRLATGGADGYVRLWSTNSANEHLSWLAATNDVRSLTFSSNGAWIASGAREPWVRVWNETNGQLVAELPCGRETNYANTVVFSPDGSVLAAACHDAMVRLWWTTNWASAGQLVGHGSGVGPAVFSPDGKLLASGSADTTVRLWNWRDGRLTRTLGGHTNSITTLAFFADGEMLLSTGGNQFIAWNTALGQKAAFFEDKYARSIRRVAFTPDGSRFAYARTDSTLIMAEVPVALLGMRPDPAGLAVRWIGPSGDYILEVANSLPATTWQAIAGPFTNSPAVISLPDASAAFYRLRYTKPE